jgi:hypothetical protein
LLHQLRGELGTPTHKKLITLPRQRNGLKGAQLVGWQKRLDPYKMSRDQLKADHREERALSNYRMERFLY